VRVARDVVDELLQLVVGHKGVNDAYTDVSEDPVPYFCQMRPDDDADGGSGAVAPSTPMPPASPASDTARAAADEEDSAEAEAAELATLRADGELQCLVEEVMEEALFSIVRGANGDPGVVERLLRANSSRLKRRGTIPGQKSVKF